MPKDLTLQTTASGDTSRVPTQQGATHTPGPWYCESNQPNMVYVGPRSEPETFVAQVWAKDYDTGCDLTPSDWANARLIAQSPALLAALKALVDETERCDRPGDYGVGSTADVMQKARAAILAAEGSDRP